jgi:hypothetical protein
VTGGVTPGQIKQEIGNHCVWETPEIGNHCVWETPNKQNAKLECSRIGTKFQIRVKQNWNKGLDCNR